MSAAKTVTTKTPQELQAALLAALRRYINEYPAFRTKPEGAPGSPARRDQDRRIEIEDEAIAACADVRASEVAPRGKI